MDTRIGSKARKQRTLMKILSAPFKILSKAGDVYVKGMENCANRVNYVAATGVRLTESFSVNCFTLCDEEEFRQHLRAAAEKKARKTALQTSKMARSYSVIVGKLGRIEEDKPCPFEENVLKSELLNARSRSLIVRSNFVYQ